MTGAERSRARSKVCEGIGPDYREDKLSRCGMPLSRIRSLRKPEPFRSFTRQAEAECRSPILFAIGHEVATLGPREIPGDGESQAHTSASAAGAGGLGPVEAVEDAG
jgi:hypothetical protein